MVYVEYDIKKELVSPMVSEVIMEYVFEVCFQLKRLVTIKIMIVMDKRMSDEYVLLVNLERNLISHVDLYPI